MGPFPTDRELAALFFEKKNPVDLTGRPVLAVLYAFGGCLMDLFGPMFWAALIVGFLYAEIFLN
jgi:hypothetical protein